MCNMSVLDLSLQYGSWPNIRNVEVSVKLLFCKTIRYSEPVDCKILCLSYLFDKYYVSSNLLLGKHVNLYVLFAKYHIKIILHFVKH